MNRRAFLKTAAGGCAAMAGLAWAQEPASARRPNFIVIFTDDLGYADIGCFGAKRFRTPNIDRMAAEGIRFTDFYSSSPVCTPSRASLMTGCYAQRVSMAAFPREDGKAGGPHLVLFPHTRWGLHPDEITVAELLRDQGYATGCVGKWHLGHLPPFLPTRHGFDYYFGIPYSNDMKPTPVLRNEETIEEPADQDALTERYTDEAVRFIRDHKDRPFFLYFAHNMPHIPLHVSDKFRGRSAGGLYGDVIESIDWSVGRVLETLDELGLAENTVVVFTSDNGPWYSQGEAGGFATPLRAGKGTTYEGGMRVPCVMRWRGAIPAGSACAEVATTMDLLPTFARLAGGAPPADRIIDGKDISDLMKAKEGAKSPHEAFYYYRGNELQAVRSGVWKYRVPTHLHDEDMYQRFEQGDAPIPEALYDLSVDPGEQKSVLKDHPDVVDRLRGLIEVARADLGDSATGRTGANVRPALRV
jgi:arylsulfatase A